MYLKFYMEQIENTVVFRIIEQDLSGAPNKKHLGTFNSISIITNEMPIIAANSLHLRGYDKLSDHFTDCCVLDTNEEAKEQKQKYLKALEECFDGNKLPKRGDTVFVRDHNVEQWVKALFVVYIEGAVYPYAVVKNGYNDEFLKGNKFLCSSFREIKRTSSLKELDNNIYEAGVK